MKVRLSQVESKHSSLTVTVWQTTVLGLGFEKSLRDDVINVLNTGACLDIFFGGSIFLLARILKVVQNFGKCVILNFNWI